MSKRFAAAGMTLLLTGIVPAAQAATWYAGGGITQSEPRVEEFDSASGARAYIGYMVKDTIGVELGVQDFGSFAVSSGPNELDVQAVSASMTGFHRINDAVSAHGRISVLHWMIDANIPALPPGSVSEESGLGYGASFGIGMHLGDAFRITADLGYTFDVDTVDIISAGAGVEFRF